ncbi:MAG: molybdopterin-dependent oxidoreductase [Chloroflexota bacterium]|nr:molybdopterin-dependent oxidoreductase [Chloroflexota bacterium]
MTAPYLLTRRDLFTGLRTATGAVRSSAYTPVESFYRESRNHYPVVQSEYWRLTLARGIQELASVSYEDLLASPATEIEATLCSYAVRSSSALIGHGRWRGVALRDLLPERSTYVRVISADGRDTTLTRQQLESAVMAYTLNGVELPAALGYPVRLIVPGMYDHKCPGWVTRIELTDTPAPDYWSRHGKALPDEVQPFAHIEQVLQPTRDDTPYRLRGIAYAGLRAIQRVEVSIDDGDWTPVSLAAGAPGCWSHWHADWLPALPGSYALRVRASTEDLEYADLLPPFIVNVEAVA